MIVDSHRRRTVVTPIPLLDEGPALGVVMVQCEITTGIPSLETGIPKLPVIRYGGMLYVVVKVAEENDDDAAGASRSYTPLLTTVRRPRCG